MGRPKGSKNKAPNVPIEMHMSPDQMDALASAIKASPAVIEVNSVVNEWIEQGTACKYVRFSQIPVSPAMAKEPVWEFKLNPNTKYSVDSMVFHHDGGLIFTAYGGKRVVPTNNVGYWEPV